MLSIIIVAISLSMDTFSLSLCLGTLNMRYRKMIMFSVLVGILHFLMPLIGITLGDLILQFININTRYITFSIFFLLGIFMLLDKNDANKGILTTFLSLLIMAFLVSIDSFVAGIGINLISNKHLLCCSTFSIFSFFFTMIGLFIGKRINNRLGNVSKTIGALILIALSIQYLTNS